jgi:putative membrane protein insertion efficiency factor
MRRLLMVFIALYQRTLSPLLGDCCRFEPSCSHYAAACIAHHGAFRGAWLALMRVLRCHPFAAGGIDPPPVPNPPEPDWDRVVRLSGCPKFDRPHSRPGANTP